MRKIGILLIFAGILFFISRSAYRMYANYQFANTVGYNWTLADRASTIAQKSEYIDKFVLALESSGLDGLNCSLIFPTPSREFDNNLKSLKSLQSRLKKISSMDENDFAYQTAMQQITAQEQGEATEMIDIFNSCWHRKNYYTLWSPWYFWGFLTLQFLLIFIGWVLTED